MTRKKNETLNSCKNNKNDIFEFINTGLENSKEILVLGITVDKSTISDRHVRSIYFLFLWKQVICVYITRKKLNPEQSTMVRVGVEEKGLEHKKAKLVE